MKMWEKEGFMRAKLEKFWEEAKFPRRGRRGYAEDADK
jgi:hypothetical protein